MKSKLFNTLLLFCLFGIALGFFGILYESAVLGPKMLDHSMLRMIFWRDFYAIINPAVYYIPVYPLATGILIVLYFNTPKQKTGLKKYLKLAIIFQIVSLILAFYVVTQVNLKMYFGNIGKYNAEIPARTIFVNCLNILRIAISAIALMSVFNAYITTTVEVANTGQKIERHL